ncbi:hypothetical protein TeGR_g3 [Tetraparma gracilis]|uniref:Coatomer subunit delta n=1 Tax=Tetraparma gracilis TaxID=2962635 RepID=A0ABQ6MNC3_9STRA|nr:hypothetical protein TeGR_g3 [Tetraparma gracilis]
MSREGEVLSCEVKGTLSLTANTDEGSTVQVVLDKAAIASSSIPFTLNTHPKIDKATWESSGVLSIKGGKGIPLNRPVGVLRWSHSSPAAAPITVNCWAEPDGSGGQSLCLEYEARDGMELGEVQIVIPGVHAAPTGVAVEPSGMYKHQPESASLVWYNQAVSAAHGNLTGSLEFTVAGGSADFFPIQVSFTSKPLCPMSVLGVRGQAGDVKHDFTARAGPESYTCS